MQAQVQRRLATVICRTTALFVVVFVTAAANAQQEVHKKWYVDDTAGGGGESWATAFLDLQEALEASGADEAPINKRNEIWVAAGPPDPPAPPGRAGPGRHADGPTEVALLGRTETPVFPTAPVALFQPLVGTFAQPVAPVFKPVSSGLAWPN